MVNPVQDIQQNDAYGKLEMIHIYFVQVSSVRDFRGFNLSDRHRHRYNSYLTLCFDYWIVQCCEIDCAITCPFMVI